MATVRSETQLLREVIDSVAKAVRVQLASGSIDLSGVTVTVQPDANIAASFDSAHNRIRVGLPAELIEGDKLKVVDSQIADVITAIRESAGGGSSRSARPIAAVRDIDENGNVTIKDYVVQQDSCIFKQVEVVNV